ncbi:UDP-N-acetylmuramoyl-L-alanyl-D-glutamate--2,6-diaminopimelate ligase [Virgibacillus sp. W0430]|uniref:UDP-N-acetylmuramoyl-L-alanyl-D-glutamate--2, 6-diaminopimelate ligase n=1 Tax=Virgibacillus sp. W0430 TaxID=3391580 RepID=UPI003F45F791
MKLQEILSILPYYKINNEIGHLEINKIETDHRNIEQGDLFICIRGFTVDGHDFALAAIENGAVAILAEKELNVSVPTIVVADTSRALAMVATKFYHFPTQKFPLIGVTGTNGKTTVTYLLESICNYHRMKTGLIGTIQMKIGKQAYPVKNTTPDALFLQKMFHQMANENVDAVMMEVSSHALDLGRVYGCNFDIAIFTNLSQDHLDYHKDMDDYLRAKSLLFAQLGSHYDEKQRKFAIINYDDPHHGLIQKSTSQAVLTYGCTEGAQVRASNIVLDIKQTSFELETPVGKVKINSNLIGKFNVYNMLAASAAAIAMNVPLSTIKEALQAVKGVNGRFEQVMEGQDFAVIVDYAHTQDSLENVLQTIKQFSKRKVYVVVGCGGDRDRTKRPLMANAALKYADWAIFTSDNPRTEDPEAILADMTNALKEDHFEIVKDRKEAIYHAIDLANKDDIVLIAGKGHETYQEVNGIKHDFDDRLIAGKALRSKEI